MVRTGIASWAPVALLLGLAGCRAPAGPVVQTIATVRVPVPEPGRPRKAVIVRGVELSGLLTMRYEHGCARLNGVEWLSAPTPQGFMIPKATLNAAELTSAAVRMFEAAPRVAELKRQGLTTNRSIEIYFAQQDSLLEYVSATYVHALPRGKAVANRIARQAIDPGLASSDSAGPTAASFSSSGSISLYFYGQGVRAIMREGTARVPSPRETATWLQSRAEGNYQELGRMLELDAPVFALSTAGTSAFYIGADATHAFEEWDRVRGARSAAELRGVARSLKVLPAKVAIEFEQAKAVGH